MRFFRQISIAKISEFTKFFFFFYLVATLFMEMSHVDIKNLKQIWAVWSTSTRIQTSVILILMFWLTLKVNFFLEIAKCSRYCRCSIIVHCWLVGVVLLDKCAVSPQILNWSIIYQGCTALHCTLHYTVHLKQHYTLHCTALHYTLHLTHDYTLHYKLHFTLHYTLH